MTVTNPSRPVFANSTSQGFLLGNKAPQASVLLHILKQEDRLSCVLNCLFKEVWTVTALKINLFPSTKSLLTTHHKRLRFPKLGVPFPHARTSPSVSILPHESRGSGRAAGTRDTLAAATAAGREASCL